MLYDVYDQSNHVIGQVEASDIVEAWPAARSVYELGDSFVLDVRPVSEEGVSPITQEIMEKKKVYSFIQPVRGGYYYIAALGETFNEALAVADSIVLINKTGRLKKLSEFNQDELVLEPNFRARLVDFGYAHRFVTTWPLPYHERTGHYGFLPQ